MKTNGTEPWYQKVIWMEMRLDDKIKKPKKKEQKSAIVVVDIC